MTPARQLQRIDHLKADELPWVEFTRNHGIIAARDLLLERGVPASVAAPMAVWFADQGDGRRTVTDRTAGNYRRLVREVGCPSHDPSGSADTFRVSAIRLLRAA